MKKTSNLRICISFLVIFAMLSPVSIFALGDGKKHFREGMKQETAEAWDKAAEEFALAVTDNPKNPEYRLHLQRALFNASQMFMKKGAAAAAEKDYEAGYTAFRKAFAYDPTNQLAKSEMDRMVRLHPGSLPQDIRAGSWPVCTHVLQRSGDYRLYPPRCTIGRSAI